jgi:general secretion pathway protein D
MQRLSVSTAILAVAFTIGTSASAQQSPAPAGATPAPAAAVPEPSPRPPPRGVDIEEVLRRVAASTGKKFLVDPRVRASVFMVPEFQTPTYAELLSILSMHGFAAAEIEGRVHIVPDANARFLPARLVQSDDPSVPADEYVMRVLSVPNSAQLVAILRPLMPQSAHLASSMPEGATEGKLILVDSYANVRKITELVNALATPAEPLAAGRARR